MAGMPGAEAAFGDRTRGIEPDHTQDGHIDTGRDRGFSRRGIRYGCAAREHDGPSSNELYEKNRRPIIEGELSVKQNALSGRRAVPWELIDFDPTRELLVFRPAKLSYSANTGE
jgi:hypothetical protein